MRNEGRSGGMKEGRNEGRRQVKAGCSGNGRFLKCRISFEVKVKFWSSPVYV